MIFKYSSVIVETADVEQQIPAPKLNMWREFCILVKNVYFISAPPVEQGFASHLLLSMN